MTESFFRQIVVPVANREDAAATAAALRPYLSGDSTVIAVHVIEKAGGAPDKASVEQLELRAEDIFTVVVEGLDGTEATVETDLRYGTDIAASIIGAAHDLSANTIAFTPRGGSRWRKLLSGDVTHYLVQDSDIPILVLPDREEAEA